MFTDPATTEIYTLSLHDALPILDRPLHEPGQRSGRLDRRAHAGRVLGQAVGHAETVRGQRPAALRSEEHTSVLQSHSDLVCRLLLEKKKKVANAKRSAPNCRIKR